MEKIFKMKKTFRPVRFHIFFEQKKIVMNLHPNRGSHGMIFYVCCDACSNTQRFYAQIPTTDSENCSVSCDARRTTHRIMHPVWMPFHLTAEQLYQKYFRYTDDLIIHLTTRIISFASNDTVLNVCSQITFENTLF